MIFLSLLLFSFFFRSRQLPSDWASCYSSIISCVYNRTYIRILPTSYAFDDAFTNSDRTFSQSLQDILIMNKRCLAIIETFGRTRTPTISLLRGRPVEHEHVTTTYIGTFPFLFIYLRRHLTVSTVADVSVATIHQNILGIPHCCSVSSNSGSMSVKNGLPRFPAHTFFFFSSHFHCCASFTR